MTSENIKANHELPTVSHLSKSDYSPAFHRRVQRLRLESWTSSFCSLPMFILLFKESHWIPNPMNKFSPKQQSGGVPALIPSHSRHTYTGPSTMPLKEICCGIAMWIMVGWLIFIKLREKEKYISKIKKTAFFFSEAWNQNLFGKNSLGDLRMTDDTRSQKPDQQEPEDQYESSYLHSERYCPLEQTRGSGHQATSGQSHWAPPASWLKAPAWEEWSTQERDYAVFKIYSVILFLWQQS